MVEPHFHEALRSGRQGILIAAGASELHPIAYNIRGWTFSLPLSLNFRFRIGFALACEIKSSLGGIRPPRIED
jgi:hypothetical protein